MEDLNDRLSISLRSQISHDSFRRLFSSCFIIHRCRRRRLVFVVGSVELSSNNNPKEMKEEEEEEEYRNEGKNKKVVRSQQTPVWLGSSQYAYISIGCFDRFGFVVV